MTAFSSRDGSCLICDDNGLGRGRGIDCDPVYVHISNVEVIP